MIEKIISGAQIGTDAAALKAAKACGILTGGYMTKGCKTLDGPKPEYIKEFNIQELASYSYSARTEMNVSQSDGTIRFAEFFLSAGEKCTLKHIKWHNKPYLDVNIKNPIDKSIVINWLKENNIKILNVAGNSEQTSPGIGKIVYNYLIDLFGEINVQNSK